MAERSKDWFRQAEADLRHARNARAAGDYDWAAFASHQAAEKAIKAVFQKLHQDAWGHVLSFLLAALPDAQRPDRALIDRAKQLQALHPDSLSERFRARSTDRSVHSPRSGRGNRKRGGHH